MRSGSDIAAAEKQYEAAKSTFYPRFDAVLQRSANNNVGGNKGFEGLAYDSVGKRLFVAKERDPMLIYEIHGFPHFKPEKTYSLGVQWMF